MPKNQYVDFKAVKSAVSMEQALQHDGLLEKLKRSGDSLRNHKSFVSLGGASPTRIFATDNFRSRP